MPTISKIPRNLSLLVAPILLCLATSVLAAQFAVIFPNRSTDLSIFTVENRAFVDAQTIATVVSGELQANLSQGTASFRMGPQVIKLDVRSSRIQMAGRPLTLSSPPRLLDGRFLVPLELLQMLLTEQYGKEGVEWRPDERLARIRSQPVTITQIRVGADSSRTRVVLDTVGPHEWSVQRDNSSDALRILVPGGVLANNVHPFMPKAGLVREIHPTQQPGGIEVKLLRAGRGGGVVTFALENPDRIVIDLFVDQSRLPDRMAGEQRSHSSPSDQAARPGEASRSISVAETPGGGQQSSTASGDAAPDRTKSVAGSVPPTPMASQGSVGESGALTVVLDPGHGGHDTGAVGPSGLMEKDVVLDLAIRLRRLLTERLGIRVIMTRTEDVFVPLQERTAIANRAKADFFLSLHMNAAPKRGAGGFETFYYTREPSDSDARASAQRENLLIEGNDPSGTDIDPLLKITLADMAVKRDMQESGELAELVLASLDQLLKVENRGVKSGPFYVLATAAMPAILVESAFITNPKEERKLTQRTYRESVAEALYTAIAKYKVRYERRVGMGGRAAATGS